MPILKTKEWEQVQAENQDDYGGVCIEVARRVMTILDEEDGPFDANNLISRADHEMGEDGGITGFMSGAAASVVSRVHSRGNEFKESWNHYYDPKSEQEGVINPALVTIGGEE